MKSGKEFNPRHCWGGARFEAGGDGSWSGDRSRGGTRAPEERQLGRGTREAWKSPRGLLRGRLVVAVVALRWDQAHSLGERSGRG